MSTNMTTKCVQVRKESILGSLTTGFYFPHQAPIATHERKPVSWIHTGFKRIRIQLFYLNADPDPGQTFKSQQVEFLHENTPY
jgi:hypothetical protein